MGVYKRFYSMLTFEGEVRVGVYWIHYGDVYRVDYGNSACTLGIKLILDTQHGRLRGRLW